MWIAERSKKRAQQAEGTALLGQVTLGGDPAGVQLGGERRALPIFAPGGYTWRPRQGEQVLVLKTGGEGEQPCVAGARCPSRSLQPGEVCIEAADGRAAIYLRAGGGIELTGRVRINGMAVGRDPEEG